MKRVATVKVGDPRGMVTCCKERMFQRLSVSICYSWSKKIIEKNLAYFVGNISGVLS
jgi:hypothetical protein